MASAPSGTVTAASTYAAGGVSISGLEWALFTLLEPITAEIDGAEVAIHGIGMRALGMADLRCSIATAAKPSRSRSTSSPPYVI